MKKKLLEIVEKLPTPINFILMKLNCFPNLIYGKKYVEYKRFIKRNRDNYNNLKQLSNLVNFSIENVPFYSSLKKIDKINDFENTFSFIDKDVVAKNMDALLSRDFDKTKYDLVTTGGTGGNPLKMYLPKDRYIIELATMHTLWENVGFKHDVRAVIRNKKLPKNIDYVINPITKEVIFDAFRVNDIYFKKIYDVIKKYKIAFIHAYPSFSYEFFRFIISNNLDFSFIKAFLSGSENVYEYQKEFFKKHKMNFYNWYGHSEKLVLGGYCKGSDYYHIEPTYGYFELIDEQGNPITEPGKVGEIVGTTLHNFGMPLIRYRTDDFAEYVGDYCEHCNRHVTLIKNIKGRRNGSKIYGADGSITTTTALNFHDDLYIYIAGLQYVQNEKGKIEILIIRGENFDDSHHKRITEYYKSKFSSNTLIQIKYVDKLIRKPNGKFVELISTIKE